MRNKDLTDSNVFEYFNGILGEGINETENVRCWIMV